MNEKRIVLLASAGCVLVILLLVCSLPLMFFAITQTTRASVPRSGALAPEAQSPAPSDSQPTSPSQHTVPQLPAGDPSVQRVPGAPSSVLTELYRRANPGVVSIEVRVSQGQIGGVGAGSGFILDNDGHIVTNNHVVADADQVIVVFYDGIEVEAEVIGTDADSDLAILRVDQLTEGAHPLPLGDSDLVQPGEWVVAIGNPFQFGGSMMIGIVSAVGRTIPSGATPFSIPQAIQTDAAINPGNSGGPLLNLKGEVIGVNAQIAQADAGVRANAGVGFAIPSNVVRLVAPSLIEKGFYVWPWLGVRGTDVNLTIAKANQLDTQRGAYISEVLPDSPADKAGLQGSSRTVEIDGVQVEAGGDIVIAVEGRPVKDFNDLLVEIAFRQPGETVQLTILRDGKQQQVEVTLAPRPRSLTP